MVFNGRSLPLGVYDELVGILAHGCIGELMTLSYFEHEKQQIRHHRRDDIEDINFAIR